MTPEPMSLLDMLEVHSGLAQALAGLVTAFIAGCAFLYTVLTLRSVQRQTVASVAMTTESFRPIVEVIGGGLGPQHCELTLRNKGAGPALNLRWKLGNSERWFSGHGNVLSAGEEIKVKVFGPCKEQGLVLSYESVAQRGELLTFSRFDRSTLEPINQHSFSTDTAITRTGWTIANPELRMPAYHPDLIASMPLVERVKRWYGLKRGRERPL